MNKNTRIYFVLDASGSMGGREQEVITHFNEYLEQYKDKTNTYVTVITFSADVNNFKLLRHEESIQFIPKLTREDYRPSGGTALNDAIGRTMDLAETFAVDDKLVLVISDGDENSSKRYPGKGNLDLKARVDRLDKKQWAFVYIGENQADAVNIGDSFGAAKGNSAMSADFAGGMRMMTSATSNYYANAASGLTQENLINPEDAVLDIKVPQIKTVTGTSQPSRKIK